MILFSFTVDKGATGGDCECESRRGAKLLLSGELKVVGALPVEYTETEIINKMIF